MPGGPLLPGFAAFGAVKFAGYTGAAWVLNRKLQPPAPRSPLIVGATRLGIGLVAGLSYGAFFTWAAPPMHNEQELWFFFGLLVPIRLVEWYILLRLFFSRELHGRVPWGWMVAGSALSYVLDLIGVSAAFVVPGGVWLC